MGQSPSYTIRALTEDDREQVLNIRPSESVNRGCDYLPDYYQMLMQSEVTKGYVALLQDRFIAVAFFSLIDEDKTVVLRAYRINPDYGRKGIGKMLTKHVLEKYFRRYNVKYWTSLTNIDLIRHRIESKDCNELVYRKKLAYVGNEATIKPKIDCDECDISNILLAEDMLKVFESQELRSQLFKNDILLVFLVPYRPIRANVPWIMNSRCLVHGSNIFEEDTNRAILSYGNYSRCGTGVDYYVDTFGATDTADNVDALTCHIKSHLYKSITITNEEVHMFVYVDKDTNTDMMDDVFKKFGLTKNSDAECTDVVVNGRLTNKDFV